MGTILNFQVGIAVEIVKGSSIRKLLVREAKNRAAAAVIVGINKNSPLGYTGKVSIAKYCAKRLALTTQVMAVHNGKIIYQNCPKDPNFCKDYHSEFGDSELSVSISSDFGGRVSYSSKDEGLESSPFQRRRTLSGISLPVEEFTQQKPGWPLLQTSGEMTQLTKEARKMSVVQWVMNLPSRSRLEIPQNFRFCADVSSDLEHLLKVVEESNGCKLFSYETLRNSTSQFCSDNLIGKGGCNSVYKGILADGKAVAIKVMNSSKKAWKEFTLEIDIMTTLKHKNITRLLGICLADEHLISVHDFLPKGSLEDNLHGNNSNKDDNNSSVLGWEVRYNIAIGIAEGLNYLHSECPRTVIHRDVKSSNILLNDEFEPQLSDFGLSIWGPRPTKTTESSSYYVMDSDVVGTFGYLAPEYFMYGKVSHKVDVYSYGVVLLELLSGRRAIGFEKSKGQEESLVIWARPKLENGDVNGILDPKLGKDVDGVQVQRMVCAAKLCLTQSARRRPDISQVLKILTGEKVWEQGEGLSREKKQEEYENDNFEVDDDEVYFDSGAAESHLSTALSDVFDNSASFSSQDQSSPLSVEDYLRRRWSRSSSNIID
ncbi:OLC1v1003500C5 [Oldenlandia corymbosa var. corymbosa]|uniref:OLC1v1003500C5 n=1 Tax=Oldenlandia corymbosa var. corymbosa TaxID=529605 RepID=A0AAV1DA68_OLDCO|nr:OLC1v1003500C5 [Oldenlandia corymbosa var. corymbosa]